MFYLVAYGLRAAPLKQDLFDAAGTGHPETLRPFQFGFRVHWFGAAVHKQGKDTQECFSVLETTSMLMSPKCNRKQHLPVARF